MQHFQSWTLRLHIAWLATLMPVLCKRLSMSAQLRFFTPARPSRLYLGVDSATVLAIVEWRLRHPWRMRGRPCLRRGLLAFKFLRMCGYDPRLHFAVFAEQRNGREQAHCWVTLDGIAVTPTATECHVVILVHPKPLQGARSAA